MISKIRAELEPLSDRLQDAGSRGVSMLRKLPYGGMQYRHRAFQRDPFLISIHDAIPAEFGTFTRVDNLLAQRRLVYHSDALNLDLIFRRRGSMGAYSSAKTSVVQQLSMFPDLQGRSDKGTRKAALIWDVPEMDRRRHMTGPMKVVAKLAREGSDLDDNEWEDGFVLCPRVEDLIPSTATYAADKEDWDVDGNEYTNAE